MKRNEKKQWSRDHAKLNFRQNEPQSRSLAKKVAQYLWRHLAITDKTRGRGARFAVPLLV